MCTCFILLCKVKEYSDATLHVVTFASDYSLTTLSIASVGGMPVLGTANSLILQGLTIARIIHLIFLESGQEKYLFKKKKKLFMKLCVHHR